MGTYGQDPQKQCAGVLHGPYRKMRTPCPAALSQHDIGPQELRCNHGGDGEDGLGELATVITESF